jgi:hypothetical protein
MKSYDVTILTDQRYVKESYEDQYSQNVLKEDTLLREALQRKGLNVHRTNWDNPDFDWTSTKYILFRTTWDYFNRFEEFSAWLEIVSTQTKLINERALIYWNVDKHYLKDLSAGGVRIPNTIFIEQGDSRSLEEVVENVTWNEVILKPTISGAARHTYRFVKENASECAEIYRELIANESMMIQEFQVQILTKGEIACMVYGGKFSHAILKRGKPGDFRVQDDFGGTIESYLPNADVIAFVEQTIEACDPKPVYARVDIIWNNENELCLGELELIEPELWFRMNADSADDCAEAVVAYIS